MPPRRHETWCDSLASRRSGGLAPARCPGAASRRTMTSGFRARLPCPASHRTPDVLLWHVPPGGPLLPLRANRPDVGQTGVL